MSASFDDFVNTQAQKISTKDYQKIRDEWLADLKQLYIQLQDYLKKYIDNGKILVFDEDIQIQEQLLGRYTAPSLRIGFQGNSNAQIQIFPKGLHVIGARGRVDIDGPKGTAMLVRVPEETIGVTFNLHEEENENLVHAEPEISKDVWKFSVRTPRITFYPLTKETFQETIMHLVEG